MKNAKGCIASTAAFITMTALFLTLAGFQVSFAVDIAPGTTSPPLQAEACSDTSGSFIANNWGICTDGCMTDCETGSNTAGASLQFVNLDIGRKFVTNTIYTDFTVSADSMSVGNSVNGTVAYDVGWAGGWTLSGVFTGYNDASSKITLTLYDLSQSGKIVKATTLHSKTPDGFIGIDIIDVGFGTDAGSAVSSMAAPLVRGHTYRLGLTVHCEGKGALNASVTLDYLTGGWGIWWNDLTVTVGSDLASDVEQLKRQVDSLEMVVDELHHDLKTHTHTYLTGKGEGHNNTVATTSMAIFFDDSTSAADEIPDFGDSDTGADLSTAPTQSKLYPNYPNPFNPTTRISFQIAAPTHVTVDIFNTLGQKVKTLVDRQMEAGMHDVVLDAGDMASGIYFYRLTTDSYRETRKLVLVK